MRSRKPVIRRQAAVGSVVVNRINSPRFGNTLQAVLYAPSQFSPVASGRFSIVLARGANEECTRAAKEVLDGHITINALYFHVYNSEVDTGGTVIGDHVFLLDILVLHRPGIIIKSIFFVRYFCIQDRTTQHFVL